MTAITLNLTKPNEVAPKISLNLKKGEKFTIKLSWDGGTDIDSHALVCFNYGDGAKLTDAMDILSTYNVKRRLPSGEVGNLTPNADGTFSVRNGALVHSKDATNGFAEGDDEWIVVNPSLLNGNGAVIEIPVLAMIHPQSPGNTFRNVQNAKLTILNSNNEVLLTASLSSQFAEYVGVQAGSIIIDQSGTSSFTAVGVGFNGDFNDVLGHFC